MENLIAKLQDYNDDNEQCSRRLCLRINGIPPPSNGEKETGEDCLEKVKKVFNQLEVDIPDSVVDRAHRIGRPQTVRGKTIHQVIVRFTTWRHKTKIYRARKKCSEYRIKLDLTKKRVKSIKSQSVAECRRILVCCTLRHFATLCDRTFPLVVECCRILAPCFKDNMAGNLETDFLALAGNFITLSLMRRVLDRRQRRKPRVWIRKFLKKRNTHGIFHTLVQELRFHDRENFFR